MSRPYKQTHSLTRVVNAHCSAEGRVAFRRRPEVVPRRSRKIGYSQPIRFSQVLCFEGHDGGRIGGSPHFSLLLAFLLRAATRILGPNHEM